eukprot:2709257-Amphidinium_carterae.1
MSTWPWLSLQSAPAMAFVRHLVSSLRYTGLIGFDFMDIYIAACVSVCSTPRIVAHFRRQQTALYVHWSVTRVRPMRRHLIIDTSVACGIYTVTDLGFPMLAIKPHSSYGAPFLEGFHSCSATRWPSC